MKGSYSKGDANYGPITGVNVLTKKETQRKKNDEEKRRLVREKLNQKGCLSRGDKRGVFYLRGGKGSGSDSRTVNSHERSEEKFFH